MIYDDFSREFYRLLMNLNHELQMSLENQSLLGESGYDRFVPTVTYQKSQLALTMGFNQYANQTYVKPQNNPKNWLSFALNLREKYYLHHSVWKSQKRSHSTLRAKRATFTFWVDKSWLKMPKMVHFGEFLKIWSLRSNRVTRQVSFNRSKIGGKCQN